jgi:hypothetical protein
MVSKDALISITLLEANSMKSQNFLILNSTRTHVVNVVVADIDFVTKHYPNQFLPQSSFPGVSIGYFFNQETETWEAPPVAEEEIDDRPELVCSEQVIECTDSKALSLDFEVRVDGEIDKTFNEKFCVPFRSTDGSETLVLFEIKNGKFKLQTTIKRSGVWKITEDKVNMYSHTKFKFSEVTIFVFQE